MSDLLHRMPPPMDLAYLDRLCKGDRSRMAEYITLYLQETPGLFAHLETMLNTNDNVQLAKAAHGLHPHVHYMGADRLCALLIVLQQRANAEGAAACAAAVQECGGFLHSVHSYSPIPSLTRLYTGDIRGTSCPIPIWILTGTSKYPTCQNAVGPNSLILL